jgi:hypothetical protein
LKKQIYISKCIQLIEDKLQWGNNADWIDYNFKELSEQIFEVSKVSISIRTLKRIFKSASSEVYYEPQIATKNALAQFLNYNSWAHFISDNFGTDEVKHPEQRIKKEGRATWPVRAKIGIGVAILIVIFAFAFFAQHNNKVVFFAKNLIGPAPHNAAFSYDLSDISFKNAIIGFDDSQFKPLISDKGEMSHNFKTPNFYKVKLMVDGKIVSSVNVDVISNGWVSFIGNDDNNARVIKDKSVFIKDGLLYFSPEEIRKINVNTDQDYWVDFRNIRNYHMDGDNFILEMRLKNSKAIGGVDCYDTCIEYVGETGRGRYKFVRPGCTQYADTEFGDTQLTGNFHNLSGLGMDLADWTNIKIEVKNKTAKIYANNKLKYKTTYNTSIGNVRGFFCRFKGSGALDYIRVYDLNKKLLYRDEF